MGAAWAGLGLPCPRPPHPECPSPTHAGPRAAHVTHTLPAALAAPGGRGQCVWGGGGAPPQGGGLGASGSTPALLPNPPPPGKMRQEAATWLGSWGSWRPGDPPNQVG